MKKYKIGYTTGVYDLFHIGHLNILKNAKELCEYLIVGVSTDELVMEYKSKKTVIPFEERKQIIEAIKYIDEVIVQEDMDKYGAWEKYHFDVLFHGDDWKNSSLYNEMEEKLKQVGVDLVFFPYTKGTSSTELKRALYTMSEGQV
ncbi:MAG: adenylyltransferase/cytidyltransferase family protein [Chitinispirillales bacterium]|jgi:glycerol-3-phosphate cytidylyltransferase|nr:adenylyltransferase/cytidyltransferase family protein [Chitinispirillales bacterium]